MHHCICQSQETISVALLYAANLHSNHVCTPMIYDYAFPATHVFLARTLHLWL
ncbi:hypothetical protein PISMIDRAFT_675504 [Pisolithus microcarpus 441]|uniref:Uncharacterized protein n=1 Tax=Pisolithus microcarpus 441 TaxID=765257 RepID=A0A0C9YNM4_9AGAM|nr:hypothetical protein PISMIDRAFT_675504 [Pisolithus microcarpus 441]